ncbi:MAG: type I-E CRISPR-associated protein Cse2/CasB [Nitrococcus mobilis]|nr:type I-E CRISPR-associated protein Cse2/CasB [Nitrococcus mobilis]
MPQADTNINYPADLAPRLAAVIHADGFPNGERARLKRMSLSGPTPLSYHRFLLRYVPPRWHGKITALAWRTLISALARQHQNPHNPSMPFGHALAESDYSELRLESLLAAEGRVLATLTLRAATRLAAGRVRCNWKDIAWLLFAVNNDTRERVNQRIARDFYRTPSAKDDSAVEFA